MLGGRWKPLQYWYKSSVLTDVTAACGTREPSGAFGCYVKNDRAGIPFVGQVYIDRIKLSSGVATPVAATETLQMAAGPGVAVEGALKELEKRRDAFRASVEAARRAEVGSRVAIEAPGAGASIADKMRGAGGHRRPLSSASRPYARGWIAAPARHFLSPAAARNQRGPSPARPSWRP